MLLHEHPIHTPVSPGRGERAIDEHASSHKNSDIPKLKGSNGYPPSCSLSPPIPWPGGKTGIGAIPQEQGRD